MVSWFWWRRLSIFGNLNDFVLVHDFVLVYNFVLVHRLLNNLLLVNGHLNRFRNRNWIWNLYRHGDLHVLAAHLLDDLCALLVVGDVLNHFVLRLTFLLEGLNTFFLGNIDRCLVTLCLDSGHNKVFNVNELCDKS